MPSKGVTMLITKGVTMLNKQRTQELEEVGNFLLVWLNEKQLQGRVLGNL